MIERGLVGLDDERRENRIGQPRPENNCQSPQRDGDIEPVRELDELDAKDAGARDRCEETGGASMMGKVEQYAAWRVDGPVDGGQHTRDIKREVHRRKVE